MVEKVSVFKPGWVRTSATERAPLNDERLSPEDSAALGAYLENGTVVMHTTDRTRDVLADNDDKVVPLTVRTDGKYVWTGPVAYYVQKYAVAPEREFIDYVKARKYETRTPTDAEIAEAIATVRGRR
jgi:hypothetical protein